MPRKPKRIPKISIIIPFKSNDPHRREIFRWILDYWEAALPDAEIVVGHSMSVPFNKMEALNNGLRKAHGQVLAIFDADALLDADVVEAAADEILNNLDNHLWIVPYRKLYRLNEEVTEIILESDPTNPLFPADPPPDSWLDFEISTGKAAKYGRAYAALAYMIPAEALDVLGCWDERFSRGWGGEDISTLRALDTLYGKHKTTNNGIFHMWHEKIGATFQTRAWEGQTENEPNKQMALRYHRATNNPSLMRELVDEACEFRRLKFEFGIAWPGLDDFETETLLLVAGKNNKFYV